MKINRAISIVFLTGLFACNNHAGMDSKAFKICDDNCKKNMSCKLTSPELRQRKATVIAELRKGILKRQETENGYRFKFNGSDSTINQLTEFIKSERQCCDFFIFNLSIADEKSFLWLEVTGKQSVKEFIKTELEM